MKTAVEWLAEHLCNEPNFDYWRAVEQAKEMEKKQIMDACKQCSYSYEEAEQYYNETFKSE